MTIMLQYPDADLLLISIQNNLFKCHPANIQEVSKLVETSNMRQ